MVTFEPIASSSAGCAYLLKKEGVTPLLIDCGLPFPQLQKASGFSLSRVAGCLISHAHGDHSKAAEKLLRHGISCYASSETWRQLGIEHHRKRTVAHLDNVQVGAWMVTPFDAQHDCPGTLGFVCSEGATRLLYLTDSAYSKYRFEGLTHICIECNFSEEILSTRARTGDLPTERYKRTLKTHMSLERLVDMLKANDLSQCREIHLLHLSDGNSDEAEFVRQVRETTGVPTYIAAKVAAHA